MRSMTILAAVFGASLLASGHAAAQQVADTMGALPSAYGTYQCGPERVVIDNSWTFSRTWDGIHYWVEKRFPEKGSNRMGELYNFAFPIHGNGLDELYARNSAPRYKLDIQHIYRSGDTDYTCTKQ